MKILLIVSMLLIGCRGNQSRVAKHGEPQKELTKVTAEHITGGNIVPDEWVDHTGSIGDMNVGDTTCAFLGIAAATDHSIWIDTTWTQTTCNWTSIARVTKREDGFHVQLIRKISISNLSSQSYRRIGHTKAVEVQ